MADSLRVLHVINALGLGGAEHVLLDLVRTLDDVNSGIVTLDESGGLVCEFNEAGVDVVSIDEGFRFDPRTIYELSRILSRQNIDVVHCHLPYAQTIGRLAGRLAGQEAIVTTQHNVPSSYHPVTRATERVTRNLDDATIAVSRGVERAHTGRVEEAQQSSTRWRTIYNGIDIERFRRQVLNSNDEKVRDALNIDEDESVFLNVGRYVPAKAQQHLINGFAAGAPKDGVLVLVGHGPCKSQLERVATLAGVTDRVRITGAVQSVYPYYSVADVFISSSRMEGLPITLLEAMAAELPIIAPSIPGVDEVVVDGETGELYPYGDVKALSKYFTEFTNEDDHDRYSKAALRRVRSVFDVNTMAEQYRRVYQLLLDTTG